MNASDRLVLEYNSRYELGYIYRYKERRRFKEYFVRKSDDFV